MLPRGAELARILHAKQLILSRRAVSHFRNHFLASYRENPADTSVSRCIKNVFGTQRYYTSKEDDNPSSTDTKQSNKLPSPSATTSKTKTTTQTATEPKALSNQSSSGKQTKKYEIETPKGILSITTTIAKLNAAITDAAKKNVKKPTTINKIKVSDINVVEKAAAAAAKLVSKLPLTGKKTKPLVNVDSNRSSLERNFITPARAMSDFLSKIKRPPITVFWRKDVEAKAISVWGSKENLIKEYLKREVERQKHQQNIFTDKRRLRDYRREIGSRTAVHDDDEPGLRGKSGKVVLIAIGINGLNFVFKLGGWLYSGSHIMFAKAIHSLAETINQLILAYGIHKSPQMADSDHPYGYTNMKYVSSLISGVGIFYVGTGLSFYHGITGLMNPEPMCNFFWPFFILGGSLVSEGATLMVAMNEVKRSAKLKGITFQEYVITGKDPCVIVVLTEDAAAVASVAVAATCLSLSIITGCPIYDAVGSLLVSSILRYATKK